MTKNAHAQERLRTLEKRLSLFEGMPKTLWQERLVGIERESLRVDPAGDIASDSHPQVLGATLTHPSITTDFSEALIELVTQAHTHLEQLDHELSALQWFVSQNIGDQLLWPGSMPPQINDLASVNICLLYTSPSPRD